MKVSFGFYACDQAGGGGMKFIVVCIYLIVFVFVMRFFCRLIVLCYASGFLHIDCSPFVAVDILTF